MDKASPHDKKKPSAEETMVFLSARAFAYDLLKCTFLQEPSKQFLTFLVKGEILQAFPFYDSNTDMGKAIDMIRTYLNQSDAASQKNYWRYSKIRWLF